MDPAEILLKWMGGFVPVPACAYAEDECTHLADPTESIFCKQHRCHFASNAGADGYEQLCEYSVVPQCGFCHDHLCSMEDCHAPVFRNNQALCAKHACFVCIREKSPDGEIFAAQDAPPRNTCSEHPLCWWVSRDGQCENVVTSVDSSYCPEHSVSKCQGKTRSGAPCTAITISRSTPFCHSHLPHAHGAASSSANGKTALATPGKCAAKTTKGKPCKGTPVPGMMFCVNHAGKAKAPTVPEIFVHQGIAQSPGREDEGAAHKARDEHKDGVEGGKVPNESCSKPDTTSLLEEAGMFTTEKDEAVVSDDAASDAASDTSGSFFDLAIDLALPNAEEDFDEPDHIQHLRDVDEVETGGSGEDEFMFGDEDDTADGEGYAQELDDGCVEYAALSVAEWHWDMSLDQRWQAIRALVSRWDPLAHKIIQAIRAKFELIKRQLQEERNRAKTKMYEGRAIIGGTITGCVTRLEAIRATKPFAILVEEASEVLEPLLFACLGSTTCKLEMIGDHLQLQPSVMSKFDFERINKINISMFERLIRAPGEYEVPSSVLSLQRRMRKNIADLTREFYVDITAIEDHATCHTKTIQTTLRFPLRRQLFGSSLLPNAVDKVRLTPTSGREVPGVAPHLYFWTHGGREEKARVGLSRINPHEADMACHLAKYLTECGVPGKSIAILTPYKGQLMLMRNLLMSQQFGMKVIGRDQRAEPSCTLSTVDRFQGDEADIVIVSLVIDGKSRTPFVKLQNRMVVLLSRARIGMYVVGNIDYFTSAATSAPPHWQVTLDKLQLPAPSDNTPDVDAVWPSFDQARIGAALPLCCPQHRDSVHSVVNPKKLALSFCAVVCRHTLECSHECGKRCHWSALDQHTKKCDVQVDSPCVRHPKALQCAQVCQATNRKRVADALIAYRCAALVELQLPCTHVQRVACAQEVDVLEKKTAWPKCTEQAITPYVYPDCKHELSCSCDAYYGYQSGSARAPNCSIDVEYVPPCGHTTTLKCYARKGIVEGQNQYTCAQKVKAVLPRCGHEVTMSCPTASALRSWSGASSTTFGIVEERGTYGPADHPCTNKVVFRRECGHEARVQCSAAFNMTSTKPPCPEPVTFLIPECGHVYPTTCAEARRLQQRVDQTFNVQPCTDPVDTVKEDERLSVYRNFGLNVQCKSSVTLRRNCGHEQVLPCHQARSTSQPCGETTEATRPDCGHAVTLPCALVVELQAWQPWSQVPSEQRAAVDLFISSGIVCMSLPAPQRPLSTALQTALGQCKQLVLLRRDTSCGHEGRFPCDQAVKILRGEGKGPLCNQLAAKPLGCGHTVEVSCCVDVAKYRCKQKVAIPCWNAQVCHQMVETECTLGNAVSPVKLSCQSRTLWSCVSGKHNYQVAVCSKGEPTACPACSFDSLTATIDRVRSICLAGPSEPVPWPPADVPRAAMQIPTFASSTNLRDRAKLEFYQRQLNVLERFRGWIEQEEDVWTRALYRPMYFPVFTVIDASKTTVKSPVMRFELNDFASTMTWNSLQAYPVVTKNVSLMISSAGGGKKAPPARRVVFGVFFSVGLNVNPSDAPTATKFGPKHAQWIQNQQQELGFDSAFFARTKNGMLSQGGTLRVWDPFAMFPTGEATVVASEQKAITSCLAGEFEATVKPLYDIPPARFLVFKPRQSLPPSPESIGKDEDGASSASSSLSPDDEEACRQLFEALPFAWAAGIRLFYPWSGKPLLVGSTSLPESVERQMYDKLAFLRRLSGEHGQGAKKKTKGPFDGINYLKTVATKLSFEEAELFTALDLLEVQKTATKDALAKLEHYVEHARQCHPLVLVALARLLARNPGISPRVRPEEYLRLFQTIYPDAAKQWLSPAELKMVGDAFAGGNAAHSANAKDESTMTVDERWAKLKAKRNCSSDAMDELLKMVGLARVKRFAINMFKSALELQRMTPSQRKKNAMVMNYCFVGNPGTGKTTVAKLFARILKDSGMRRNSTALLCGAQQLKDEGADKFRDAVNKAMGGVVFVDEAYELEPTSDPKGKPIVAEILVAAEEHRYDLSMILAGYEDDIQQKLYAHNDGLRSRFTEVVFEDFDEADLRVIWDGLLTEREWTCDDKVSTIACRRLARGAGRKGFGNARDVRQLFERAAAEAMAREDFDGIMELRAVDVIGERPSKNSKLELLVQELNGKIGWKRIKQRVKELIDICDANYERELNGRETLSVVMNRLFLGNPGTGKTTCASLYGKLLKHLGFLSNGDVVKKTAGDFVGQYIGQSQTKTNEILKLAKGKLLIIDEAYNLNDQWYGKQVLDVLVEKVQGSDSDDIAVILIGYEHQMSEMLRTQNPGLARRFPIEYAFYFDDYDDQELFDIFSAACERKQVDCPLDVAQEVVKLLSMQRRQANFGNAGAVEMLLKNAMANASKRPIQPGETRMLLQLEDIENEIAKRAKDDDGEGEASATKAPEDPLLVLDKLYRMDNIKDELQRLRTRIQVAEEEGEERPEIGHFVFRGSPGTGKTTVARTMGKILHNMGLLGSDRVVETSGLNLTGEYLGQTKKKVEEQLGQARGAILFIDEAYELGKGHYGEEAMTTLVAAMTDPMYDGMVIIIAGYPADMDAMLDRNAGLKSRFTRFLEFPDWETSDCVSFMLSRGAREKYVLTDNAVDALERLFTSMRLLPGFGNGRDVDKVWKSILECRAQRVVGKPELERMITLSDVEAASERVLTAREPPKAERLSRPEMGGYQRLQTDSASSELPRLEMVAESTAEQEADEADGTKQDEEPQVDEDEATSDECKRDPGVSDDVWEELERAKQAYKQMLQDMKDAEDHKKQDEACRKAELYQKAQEKLRRLAKCPAGYEWRQVDGGWRCGGGSHFVSNETLEKNFMY